MVQAEAVPEGELGPAPVLVLVPELEQGSEPEPGLQAEEVQALLPSPASRLTLLGILTRRRP